MLANKSAGNRSNELRGAFIEVSVFDVVGSGLLLLKSCTEGSDSVITANAWHVSIEMSVKYNYGTRRNTYTGDGYKKMKMVSKETRLHLMYLLSTISTILNSIVAG